MKAMSLLIFIAEKEKENASIGSTEKILISEEAYAFNLSPRDRREIKKIIFEHFEYIEQEWDAFERRRRQ